MKQAGLSVRSPQVARTTGYRANIRRPSRCPGALVTKAIMEPSTAVPFLRNAEHLKEWKPQSWRSLPALQQPSYPDKVLQPFVIAQFDRFVCLKTIQSHHLPFFFNVLMK